MQLHLGYIIMYFNYLNSELLSPLLRLPKKGLSLKRHRTLVLQVNLCGYCLKDSLNRILFGFVILKNTLIYKIDYNSTAVTDFLSLFWIRNLLKNRYI